MPIKAKNNGSYKDVTELMNVDESIDYVLAKTSSSYKRVYTATRSIEDVPPTTFKSIKPGTRLSDYRIYGQTSRNLFDMKTFAETCNQFYATVNYINNTLTFTATNVDAYVNAAYNKGIMIYAADRPSCIDVLPSTTYTISMSSAPKCFISWVNSSYEAVSEYAQIPANATSYIFTTPENCTKILIRLGKRVENIGDTFVISNIMLNEGSTPLPYEPYGESVGDRTGNLFDETIYNKNVQNNMIIYVPIYVGNIDYVTCSTTCPKTITGDNDNFNSRYIFILSGNVNTGAVNDANGVSDGAPRTIRPSNGYVTIAYRKIEGYDVRPWEYQTMLNEGSTPLPYEPYGYKVTITVDWKNLLDIDAIIYLPEQIRKVGDEAEYIDYATQKQHRVRKNLLQNTAISRTLSSGITVTVNDNKSVVINGTSTTGKAFGVVLGGNVILDKGTYILSGCPQGGSNDTYKLICIFNDNGERKVLTDNGGGATIVLNGDNPEVIDNGFYIYALSCDNNVFFPMLRKADITDDTYEPYIENTDLDVALPALSIFTGTNTLSVGTEVQPSKIDITGHIKNIPEVTS